MKISYNCLFEPWIPVRKLDGSVIEIGIVNVLKNAHNYIEIADPNPLFRFSIYRILCVIIMDAFKDSVFDISMLVEELINAAVFDPDVIDAYASKWKDRFDLFSETHPFMQFPVECDIKDAEPVSKLFQQYPSGNNDTVFTHIYEDDYCISPKYCIKAILGTLNFLTIGGRGYSAGINGAPPYYIIVKGKSLFDTIVYNCIQDIELFEKDKGPCWTQPSRQKVQEYKGKIGLLDGLTFRGRCIKLIPSLHGGKCSLSGAKSDILVSKIYFSQGDKVAKNNPVKWYDPNIIYYFKDERPLLPRTSKELWRDIGPLSLLANDNNKDYLPPIVVNQYQNLTNKHLIISSYICVEAYALYTDQARMLMWQSETLHLTTGINNLKYNYIKRQMDNAESISKSLYVAIKLASGVKSKKATFFINTIESARRSFWNALRPIFEEYVESIAKAENPVDANKKWNKQLYFTALNSYDKVAECIGSSAEHIRDRTLGRIEFCKSINKAVAGLKVK